MRPMHAIKKALGMSKLDRSFAEQLGESHPRTPDMWELQLTHFQFVFVTDEMMRGCRHHSLVDNEHCAFMGVAYTQRKFIMMKMTYQRATYPILLPSNVEYNSGPAARAEIAVVKGELYIVRPRHLAEELDTYKDNGVAFRRERVLLDLPFREKDTNGVLGEWQHYKQQDAWLYVGDPDYHYWSGYSDRSFSSVKLKVPSDRNLQPFYFYNNTEDAR